MRTKATPRGPARAAIFHAVSAARIARVMEEIGGLLEFRGENPFKVRAYRNAARTLRTLEEPLEVLLAEDRLRDLPGVGAAIEAKIRAFLETGAVPLHERLKAEIPPGVLDLLSIPGLGVTRARAVHDALGVDSLDALEEAAASGALADVPGFGPKTVANVLESLERVRRYAGRRIGAEARRVAEVLVEGVRNAPGVVRTEVAGEVRRRANVVETVAVVAAAEDPGPALEAFLGLPVVEDGAVEGREAEATLAGGTAARLRVAPPAAFGLAWVVETGSGSHVTRLADLAREAGIAWGADGLTREGEPVPVPEEADVYGAIGLPWIPPEIREDRGEVEAAAAGTLPDLVEVGDLAGVVHCHTDWSDGRGSIAAMAEAARDLGFTWLVVCDHSRSAAYAGGLSVEDLARQVVAVREADAAIDGFTILAGSEVDVRPDGTLDYPDEVLATLDCVVASVHGAFGLPREEQNARIRTALSNPWVDVLGHPTGRLLLRREGIDVDPQALLDAAAEHGVALEVNGDPRRLDLDWTLHRGAVERGIPLALDPDAHGTETIGPLTEEAVSAARKGGVTAAGVLNARDVDGFRAALRRNRG